MKWLGLIFLFASTTHAAYDANVKFGSYYETNTFYASGSKDADVAFLIEPRLFYKSDGKYTIQTDSVLTYSKYMSNGNQDYLEYDLNLKNNLRMGDSFQIYATPKAKLLSEPAQSKTTKRLDRQVVGGDFGMIYANDPRRQYILDVSYEQELLSQDAYEYLNNHAIKGRFYYKKYFLPETFVYFGVSGGVRKFPDGTLSSLARKKYDSQRVEPGLGLEGRLTRYFKIRSYFAYSFIQYTEDVNYQDPVFVLELEEEMSPKDFLVVGLENSVDDSYFTNFQINQKVYAGYGRFIGDQILWVTKVEYVYRTFSRPNRRDDQRFVADTRLEYSYSEKLKLEATMQFDILSSDAVDPDIPIDASTSYQNIRAGFFGKYLF